IKELEALEKELSKEIDFSIKGLQEIKKRHEFFEKADTLLTVVLLEFSDCLSIKATRESRNGKEVTDKILNYVKQYEKRGSRLLKKEALKGNLEAVQGLFPLFENQLGEEFYQELLKLVVCKKSEDNQAQRLIEICEFFNLNSVCYRNSVFKA